jgi:hypothetical protein
MRQMTRWLLLSIACTIAVLVSFASLNQWQWRLYERAHHVYTYGSTSVNDLSIYNIERRLTWEYVDSGPFFDHATIVRESDASRFAWGPIAIPKLTRHNDSALLATLTFVVCASCLYLASVVCIWWARTRPGLGISHESLSHRSIARLFFSLDREQAISISTTALLFGALSWYITYDRSQATRFVSETFVPSVVGIGIVASLFFVACCVIRWFHISRVAKLLLIDQDARISRGCRICAYDLNVVSRDAMCPECGISDTRVRTSLVDWRRLAIPTGVVSLGLTIAACSGIEGIKPEFAYSSKLPRWALQSWAWLSIRAELLPRAGGLLPINRVATFREGDSSARVVVVPIQSIDANSRYNSLAIAWTANNTIHTALQEELATAGPTRVQFGENFAESRFSPVQNRLIPFHLASVPDDYKLSDLPAASDLATALNQLLHDRGLAITRTTTPER